jgi:hypothetical protein
MTGNSFQSKPRNRWLDLFKALISLALLALLVSRVDLSKTLAALRGINLLLLLVAWLLYQLGMFIRGERWHSLVKSLKYQSGFWRLTALYYVGTFFSTMLPTGFGGDVVKAYELARDVGNAADATGTVLVDRWLGLLVLLIQALAALPFGLNLVPRSVELTVGGLGLGALIATVLLFEPTWQRRLVNMLPGVLARFGRKWLELSETAVHGYGRSGLAWALVYSTAFNLVQIINHWVVGLALGADISLVYYFLFVPIISVSLTLPISISGLGVREGAFVALFALAGVAEPQAFAMGITIFSLQLTTAVIGGVIYTAQGVRGTMGQRKSV